MKKHVTFLNLALVSGKTEQPTALLRTFINSRVAHVERLFVSAKICIILKTSYPVYSDDVGNSFSKKAS